MFGLGTSKSKNAGNWVPGRPDPIVEPKPHYVLGHSLTPPWPDGFKTLLVGMGCFWGAERLFWQKDGVWTTAVGYAGGSTPNPTYYEVCSGGTGHAEVVLVVYDPAKQTLELLLKSFFEGHDPTQGMRQGNDMGSQYRSCIFLKDEADRAIAQHMSVAYQDQLAAKGLPAITTTINGDMLFFYAEDEHQQYLAKKPWGYCGLGGTGVTCPISMEETVSP